MSSLEWVDVPGLGEKANGLFRQSWGLINEAEECEDPEELIDIWEEAITLEKRIQKQRDIDTSGRRNAER